MGASRRPAPPSVDWVLPPCVVGILRHYRETVDSRWMFPSPVKEDVPMTLGGGAPATPDHSGAGRVQKNQISRFTPHLFHLALRERHGCEAPLRHAGPCIGGHYPEHLYPCHRGYAEQDGDQDRPGARQRSTGGIRSVGTERSQRLPAGAEKDLDARHRVHHPDQRPPVRRPLLPPTWPDGTKQSKCVYAHPREECEAKLKVLIQQMNAARQARRDRMPGITPPDKLTKIQKKIWM